MRGFINYRVTVSLLLVLFAASCSVPNLEEPECLESRDAVKQLYSFHFANDMKPTLENFRARERFLTNKLNMVLQKSTIQEFDPFTFTGDYPNKGDYPKAFRVGECKVLSPGKTQLQVILFWRDDYRSEQKEVTVDAVKQDDKWLIDSVLRK
jgi:hypothetical protein